MTRSMSLTLLLMAGSIAAAVAAPGAESSAAEGTACPGSAKLGIEAFAEPLNKSPTIVPVMVSPTAILPCATDATERYRNWHHGSTKFGPGCVDASSV